jgi:hypothetical protein
MPITKEQLSIMKHTKFRAARGMYCGDSPAMQGLVRDGLMKSAGKVAWCPDEYFFLTPKGSAALMEQLAQE